MLSVVEVMQYGQGGCSHGAFRRVVAGCEASRDTLLEASVLPPATRPNGQLCRSKPDADTVQIGDHI